MNVLLNKLASTAAVVCSPQADCEGIKALSEIKDSGEE
jgi:hypothetical protein